MTLTNNKLHFKCIFPQNRLAFLPFGFKKICFFVEIEEKEGWNEGMKEMFYLTTPSTHFIYGYTEGRICFI